MSLSGLNVGDEVVHQSHPGRFRIVSITPRHTVVKTAVLKLISAEGVEMEVLDSTVRKVEPLEQAGEP